MINSLRYAVTFPTNGVSLNGQFSFQPGATAITGDNGAGKSFVAEMIRYGFFGKKALRGPASDYKTLDMEMSFLGHRVVRGKKEFLYDNDNEQLAVGADAVNKKIVELLGFDLEVFDVVCAANQKESERLTRLTPARRKELIDDVVGLTRQETVEKACKEEAKTARTEADTLTRLLVLPVEPVKPEGYRRSAEIKAELDETVAALVLRSKLQRVVDAVGAEPQQPVDAKVDTEKLEEHEKTRIEHEARYKALYSSIDRIPDATRTREQLEAATELFQYDLEVRRRGAKPTLKLSEEVIVTTLGMWAKHHALEEIGDIEVSCPQCHCEFQPGHSSIPPRLAEATLQQELSRVRAWAEPLVEPKGERLTQSQIAEATKALDRADEKRLMQEELDGIPELPDLSIELKAGREINQRWAIYERDLRAFEERKSQADEAEIALFDLPTPKRAPEDLHADHTAAIVYERDLTRYEADKQRFDELTAEIGEKQKRAEAFLAGAKGLVEARRTLKAFLAPSLSRVATKIIREMTANALRKIDEIMVDEDMNITADGQDVATFNGAHATMINLALRLALGQVLVARVLPLFIGDEIDSDATPANAQAIADGLMACKDQLKQIVLISHKRLEGVDHEVML